jgi:small conductance mechanosensitive channel
MHYGPRALIGIVAFYIGFWLIRKLCNGIARLMRLRRVDASLVPFLRTLISMALKALLSISILSFVGFNTASFLTALGAAGLAVGLALQGSLSNFAGGVLILLFKPFRAGDLIEAQGHRGTVKEIQILYTILITPDNKRIVIPNGNLSNKDITNFSAESLRRIDLKIAVAYTGDLALVQQLLKEIAATEPLALPEPAPIIGVHDLGEKAINLDFFFWVNRPDFGAAQYRVNERVKAEFEKAGILLNITAVPDVHVHNYAGGAEEDN